MIISDKLEDLVAIQVEAVKNLVTVWDGMAGKEGTPATANFLSGMMKSIPPMNDLFNMAGMELPDYLGKEKMDEAKDVVIESEEK